MSVPSPNKQRQIRLDMKRAIRKLAERVEKGVALFDSSVLLDELNSTAVGAIFSEQAHIDAPASFVKKFQHIRNLVAKRPLHSAHEGRTVSLERLLEMVDKLYDALVQDLMTGAHFLGEKQPNNKSSIEAWSLSRCRDLLEPPLGSAVQYRDRFLSRFKKFDDAIIKKALGLSCEEIVSLIDSIDEMFMKQIQTDLESGLFCVSLELVTDHSSLPRAKVLQFFERSSVLPGTTNANYLLPTDMADGSLFLKLDSSSFYVLDMASMYRDLYHFAVNLVEEADKATKDRYYLWRGEIVPENVKDQLAKIFPSESIFENLYYPLSTVAGGSAEADILIMHGSTIVLCEVKGHELERSISNRVGPDRMKKEFETIQKGYDQCVRTHQYVINTESATFFRSNLRTRLLTLPSSSWEFCYLIITSNSYGVLAGNCSDLLERYGTPLPVVMSDLELETIIPHMTTPDTFIKYLRQRASLHGFLKSSDELEVAGIFVTQGSLDEAIAAKERGDVLLIDPNASSVFNGPDWERIPEVQEAIAQKKLSIVTISAKPSA